MTALVGWTLLALGGLYTWRLADWARGFRHEANATDAQPPLADADLPRITVVVPARDEQDTIGPCVDSLLATDYPSGKLDVIVVDDDSSDATAEVVRARIPLVERALVSAGDAEEEPQPERLTLVQIPENRERVRAHKKRAIEKAVQHATGDLILTTDADCVVPPGWPRAMAAAFSNPTVAFVSGPVRFRLGERPSLFVRLQAMDFFGLMACGAGGVGVGRPNLANGANVGYRRDVFESLGGFSGIDHVSSGDDELFMQKVAYGTDHEVRFCASREAVVVTEPVRTLRAFVHQRRRWASKGAHYPPQLQRMLLGVVGFFAALVLVSVAALFVNGLWPYVLGALAIKAVADLLLLVPAARRFGQLGLIWVYPLHLLGHAPHSLAVGLLGPLGQFEWKGRVLDK